MRIHVLVLTALLSVTTATAQTASFSSYTKPCPSTNSQLSLTGLPKLGTTFTVGGIAFPSICTRKFCGCNIGKCNDCQGAALVLGLSKTNAPLPGGCSLHVSPDILLTAAFPGNINFPVPNDVTLLGQKFYMQRMDLALDEMIDAACNTSYRPAAFRGFSDAVEGTIGR